MNNPNNTRKYNLRAIAAQVLFKVVEEGNSLSHILPCYQRNISTQDKALLQELCFGVLRFLPQLEWCSSQLIQKKLTGKKRPLHYLILVGMYQLIHLRIPPHAILSETVNGAVTLKLVNLKGMINGVLRQFQRQLPELLIKFKQQDNTHLHPIWLIEKIQHAYPTQWLTIVESNNQKPPFWIRVNQQYSSRDNYLLELQNQAIEARPDNQLPCAIQITHPLAVDKLPYFSEGWVTVQDQSAQATAYYLDATNDDTILDLCAAPGGKTTHLLEIAPLAKIIAVDNDAIRLERVQQNLTRLKQHAQLICGDARQPQIWSPLTQYSKILVDAPCSATGVIRRHPDIKWLRQPSDILTLIQLQQDILQAIWPYLAIGGRLLYATCSILPEENQQQIDYFLTQQPDAQRLMLDKQILPSATGGDGFFYALLTKATP